MNVPEMTAEHHEQSAHAWLSMDPRRADCPDGLLRAAMANAHATLALALRCGPTTEERRQDAHRIRAEEEARSVVALLTRAGTPEAVHDVEGSWPEAVALALDRGWLVWFHERPGIPPVLTVTAAGTAAAASAPESS